MKKYLSLVLVLLVMLMPLMGVDAKKKTTTTAAGKKVNFYVFYSESCSVCASLHQYIETTLSKDKAHNYMYELVDLEASNSVNSNLMSLVSDKFNLSEDSRGRVPLIVIGEQYFLGFSLDTSPEKIVNAIEKAYKEEQDDVVAGLPDGSITVADKNLKEEEKNSDTTGLIILAIIGIVLILIVYSRGKTKEA
ncbi:MAG: hypothetical protein OSJ70_01195 [Bacilli bacterium]|nr:hypothetical protein [Bacilli bacterium]